MSTGRDAYVGSPITPMPRPNATSDAQRKLAGAGPGVGGAGSFSGGGFAGTPGITPGITTGGPPTVGGPAMRGGGSAAGVGPVQPSPGQGQAVGRGGVGAPGARGAAAGMGGVPMGAPGRGNGEEDQEHRNKYVIEPDSDELFGVDEQYAPPVIGEHP